MWLETCLKRPVSEFLRLLVNKMAADDKCSLLNRENLPEPIQQLKCNYLTNKKLFLNF